MDAASWCRTAPTSTSSALRAARARWRRGWAARWGGSLWDGTGWGSCGFHAVCVRGAVPQAVHPFRPSPAMWLTAPTPSHMPALFPSAALPERVWRRHPHRAPPCHWPLRAGQWHRLLADGQQPRGAVGGSGAPAARCGGHLPQVINNRPAVNAPVGDQTCVRDCV